MSHLPQNILMKDIKYRMKKELWQNSSRYIFSGNDTQEKLIFCEILLLFLFISRKKFSFLDCHSFRGMFMRNDSKN